MNNRSREKDPFVEEQDWITQGYTYPLLDNPIRSKLTNDIHPMFSFELDESPGGAFVKARWGGLTMKDYELLDQPLRLATQWLESAPSSDAICSIIAGERYIPPGVPMHHFEFRHHRLLPSTVHERAGNALKQLGKSVTFRIADRASFPKVVDLDGDHGGICPWFFGHPEGIAITHDPQKKGLASTTYIHKKYLKTLRRLLDHPSIKKLQILKLYFEFALTICHEVIHAVNLAVESELLSTYIEMGDRLVETRRNFGPVRVNEPFYEGQRVAELGLFWENEVFGGVCQQSVPNAEGAIFLVEWPSWLLQQGRADPERAPTPSNMCHKSLVSMWYIQNCQTQEFWDTVKSEHSQDLLALRIRKNVSLACELPQSKEDDTTWAGTAPKNARKVTGMNCRRELSDDPDPTPCARLANETILERSARLVRERQWSSWFREPSVPWLFRRPRHC